MGEDLAKWHWWWTYKIYIEYVQVQIGHDESDYFMCKVGDRPFLFSIYINDLEDYLLRNCVNGFNCPNAVT